MNRPFFPGRRHPPWGEMSSHVCMAPLAQRAQRPAGERHITSARAPSRCVNYLLRITNGALKDEG